ncbi:MAG: hypothetical protein RJA44_1572 [Pseudomonadota bacterium]
MHSTTCSGRAGLVSDLRTRLAGARRGCGLVAAWLLCAALTACGGGGGASSGGSDTGGGTNTGTNGINGSMAPLPLSERSVTITGYAPTSGGENMPVTIYGSGFGTNTNAFAITFGVTAATVVDQTDTQITVNVPVGASTDRISIESKLKGWTIWSREQFAVIGGKPLITNLPGDTHSAGDTFDIIGKNFSTTPTDNVVTVNGTPFEVLNAAKTRLTVKVPASVGVGALTVQVGDDYAVAPGPFGTIPTVTGFSPATGTQGDAVTLTGTNLTRETRVHFGASDRAVATVLTATGTQMTVVIPDNSASGKLWVSSSLDMGRWTTDVFSLNSRYAPTITRVAPSNGLPGTTLTIYGTNFDANALNDTVRIGSTKASVIAVSEDQNYGPYILARVPQMTAGNGFAVSVTTPEGTATAVGRFDVSEIPAPPPAGTGVNADASNLFFGTVNVGNVGSKSITVTNNGSSPARMGTAGISGQTFRFSGTSCYGYDYQLVWFDTLAPGKSCTYDVDFIPTAALSTFGDLSFTAGTVSFTIPLSGTGALPPVALPVFSPTALTFAARELGTASEPQTVRLTNTGTASMSLAGTLYSPEGLQVSGEYSMTHNCPAQLAAGQGCNVNIVFRPINRVGTKEGVLSLTSPDAKMQLVSLLGEGTLAHSGKLAIYTREPWGVDNVYVDGVWAGKLNYDAQDICNGAGAITLTLSPGAHTVSGYDAVADFPAAAVTITEGACTSYKMVGTSTCKAPNFISNGYCYPPSPPLTCTAPQVLRKGVCVTPGIRSAPGDSSTVGSGGAVTGGGVGGNAGGNGGVAGAFDSTGTGNNAAQCVKFGFHPGEFTDSQSMTNICNYEIHVLYCHSPGGTGAKWGDCDPSTGHFYQYAHWLKPGESFDNYYSLPVGSTIWYGACSGGRYSSPSAKEVAIDGTYVCQ